MQQINIFIDQYFSNLHMPSIRWTDILEILIIAFLVYNILLWIKNTRAWALLRGIVVIAAFILIAIFFEMNTILWIVSNLFGIAAIAIVVILQPELRKALEELGRKNLFSSIILPFNTTKSGEGRFSDRTINEIVKASVEMGKAKTGALIVIQQEQVLYEYERTGIEVDGIVSSQLLINIFPICIGLPSDGQIYWRFLLLHFWYITSCYGLKIRGPGHYSGVLLSLQLLF